MQFEQAGLLSRSNFESGKAVFELNEGQHHDHLVCLTCGRSRSSTTPRSSSASAPCRERGFDLQEHALALYARCTKTDCPHRGK
jgi:Fur family ferric uptake transcriptional regulator